MSPEPREISDAQTMRALAHPIRLALLDAIRAEGELTASRAAEVLGDSPGNMSWHLQTLAKYGFVEDAGTGKGRSRPWRLVKRGFRFSPTTAPDAEARAAGDALESALIDRAFSQLEEWRRRRPDFPDWAEQAFINNAVTYLTPEELGALSEELQAVLNRYVGRQDPGQRPEGTVPIKLVAIGHPLVSEAPGR